MTKWASIEDRRKSERDLLVYGTCLTKNYDGVLVHVLLKDIQPVVKAPWFDTSIWANKSE